MSTARWAGLTYLFLIATGIFALAYAPGQYKVAGDAAATLARLEANRLLFANAIVAEMACYASFVALAALLYTLFRAWSQPLALAMVGLVLASVPLGFIAVGEKISALELVAAGGAQAEAVGAHLQRYGETIGLAEIFWGLWLAPYGLLVLKSRAIPRVFGVALMLGCVAYVAEAIVPLYWQGYADSPIAQYAGIPGSIGEIGGAFWLAIFGARAQASMVNRVE